MDETNLACEYIRFSSFFAAWDVSRETSQRPRARVKRMFSQAKTNLVPVIMGKKNYPSWPLGFLTVLHFAYREF